MLRRIVSLLLALLTAVFAVTGASAVAADSPPSAPTVSAKSAILIEASTGTVIFEKNAHTRLGMASTTKIMTALTVAERCSLDETVTVSREAVGVEGSSVYLAEGEKLTVGQLLYALLLASANDAAAALAIHVSGSVEAFARLMNERASAMGLKDTHFTNPHGLYDDSHYTTAYELALITSEALSNEAVRQTVSTYKTAIPKDGKEGARVLVNHNKLLRLYDGAIGVKTGFTKKTGRTLVSAAERDGMLLIAVTLNAPDDWNDHIAMLDYGFASYARVSLFDRGEYLYALPIGAGTEEYAMLTNECELSAIVKLPCPEPEYTVLTRTRLQCAPIRAGDSLGELVCRIGDSELRSALIAVADIAHRDKRTKN